MTRNTTLLANYPPFSLTRWALLALLICGVGLPPLRANNGKLCHALPVKNIKIDGDLSDWPSNLPTYRIDNYEYGAQADHEGDNQASFRVGFSKKEKALYLGVEIIDDEYVLSPDNPIFNLHDLHVLYLDPAHSIDGSGVIAYELSEDNRKIVHQEDMPWFDQVKNASWDPVSYKIARRGDRTIYEWKIVLGDQFQLDRSIGLDYCIFDKDPGQESISMTWGPGGSKFANYDRLGDVLLVESMEQLATVRGSVSLEELDWNIYPPTLRLISVDAPNRWLWVAVDSTGQFRAQIPAGDYRLSLPEMLVVNDEEDFGLRFSSREDQTFTASSGEVQELAPLAIALRREIDRLPEKGILHDFGSAEQALVDRYIEEKMAFYDIPGVSLALVREGQVVYHRTYGLQNTISQKPVEENSVFEAASITKSVFAYVVNRLAERDVIDLDRPLYEYLPFEALEAQEAYKLMTGRHVLTHLSGLPNWGTKMIGTPGEKFGYSGEGFEYLKRVVEHITGKDVLDVMREELLEPYGLHNMYFADNPQLRAQVVSGHFGKVPTILQFNQEPGMAWSMQTEAKAFARFAQVLMERKGLQPDTYNEMLRIHTDVPHSPNSEDTFRQGVGLGIFVRYPEGYGKVYGHGGNNGDFQCMYEVYDEQKMAYLVFTNSDRGGYLFQDLPQLLVEGKKESKKEE
ncbi:MAG: serine hydrolase domain-containing protein [Bacteroidota bacterium]